MNTTADSIKIKVQKRIVIISIVLFVAKISVFFITNSVGILTDALESIVNIVTAIISLYSIRVALKPYDDDHPFGHGKVEMLSASLEGILIILAGIFIIYESVSRFIEPAPIQQIDIGIWVVAIAGAINFIMGYYSIRVGKKHNSIALVSGGKHLQSDTYSTIGLVVGLFILYITNIAWIDSVIALLFGVIIIATGYSILKQTIANLMDTADFMLIHKLVDIVWKHRKSSWVDIHNVKIVKYGNTHHIDCDLRLPKYFNIEEAHTESDILKQIIAQHYDMRFDITIHVDACNESFCHECSHVDCPIREHSFIEQKPWTVESITKNSLKKS